MYWGTMGEVIESNGTDGYDVIETDIDSRLNVLILSFEFEKCDTLPMFLLK